MSIKNIHIKYLYFKHKKVNKFNIFHSFSIGDTVFVTYPYLIRVFDMLETNSYKSVEQVIIKEKIIYDVELLEKLSESIYTVLQYLNQTEWHRFVTAKCNCIFIDRDKIHFNKKYKMLKEPNISFLNDTIPVYFTEDNKYFCPIQSICSNISFTPYYNTLIIELEYTNGEFKEIGLIENNYIENNSGNDQTNSDNDQTNSDNYQTNSGNNQSNYVLSYEPNPFDYKSKQITKSIIYN